ncbi:ABC transporter ATP-binding protein [Rhodocaloribacter litoris]|uniref:ABC transporter ATP-binding protein n=1 Tax=Rhodocaloribacter litoris TaxID=2558931 RepID=UPI0014238005|nr:ABC transporter ATP-binding protein [Rhodocaloribacter litoris]QXD14898.1 ABC transporter ATP-binding protein [Rhodocaloribacter litoris]
MPAWAVECKHIAHRYGEHPALNDVTFSVKEGERFGLLGPNGSGKTTLFRILSTLLPPTEGTASVLGFDCVHRPDAVRRRLGVVFQQPALDDELTVTENLRFHAALYGLRGNTRTRRIDTLLNRFGLADRAGDRAGTLSGGLRRRVDLVRGLLHAPRLLLLDEPSTGLDPAARHAFWNAIDRLRHDEHTTILLATHLLEEAETCDRLALLDRGRLVALGTPADLKAALGAETLWLAADDPVALCARIRERFGLAARPVGGQVQLSHPEAHTLLATLYDAFGSTIRSATVRPPTLEDVFMVHTGHRLDEPGEAG